MNVAEILTAEVASCREQDSLADAARSMDQVDCGCIPVVGGAASREVVGIVTDRDICMAACRTGKPIAEIRVRDAMTSPARTCGADASVSEAEYARRLVQPSLSRIEIGATLAAICAPRADG